MKTTQPRRQRKRLFQASLHERYKHFSASLSPQLKASHNANSLPVRIGDTVRIMRGDRKGLEGKVTRVDRKEYRVFIEGVTREKVDGSTALIPIHPSKVMITTLNLDDKWRKGLLKRFVASKEEKKPEEKIAEEKLEEGRKKPEVPKKRKKRVSKTRKLLQKTGGKKAG